jgi:ATP/maltotriose-dependent transcriptional regulator MalT
MAELTDKKESFFQRPKKNRIEDQDIESAIKQDQRAAFARYRELVKVRREKEKLSPREPEIYHHDLYKKS